MYDIDTFTYRHRVHRPVSARFIHCHNFHYTTSETVQGLRFRANITQLSCI